jgi:3-phenylpropionate/trans-cinnamate dioxygenase ferredoxin subunit
MHRPVFKSNSLQPRSFGLDRLDQPELRLAGTEAALASLLRDQHQRYILREESKVGSFMADVKIDARPNGPYVVTGSIELRDTNGNVLPTQERTVLCRCGASTKKPFCDGTHSKIGFQAAAEAVPDSAEKS